MQMSSLLPNHRRVQVLDPKTTEMNGTNRQGAGTTISTSTSSNGSLAMATGGLAGLALLQMADQRLGLTNDLNLAWKIFPQFYQMWRMANKEFTVTDVWLESVAKYGDHKTAICFENKHFTFLDMERTVLQMARYLLETVRVGTGDSVCLYMENKPEFVCWWLALTRINAVVGLLNYNLKQTGLLHCIRISRTKNTAHGSQEQDAAVEVERGGAADRDRITTIIVDAPLWPHVAEIQRELLQEDVQENQKSAARSAKFDSDETASRGSGQAAPPKVKIVLWCGDSKSAAAPLRAQTGGENVFGEDTTNTVMPVRGRGLEVELSPVEQQHQDAFYSNMIKIYEVDYTDLLQIPATPIDPALRRGVKFQDLFGFIYTSGTTGLPKAARVSHLRMWQFGAFLSGLGQVTSQDRIYTCLPIFHSAGGGIGVMSMMITGATLVLARRFSSTHFWREVVEQRCTIIQYIGELCRYLVNSEQAGDEFSRREDPRRTAGIPSASSNKTTSGVEYSKAASKLRPQQQPHRNHCVRLAVGNGLRPEVWREFQNSFQIPEVLEFYGATEGNGAMANSVLADCRSSAHSFLAPFLQFVSRSLSSPFAFVTRSSSSSQHSVISPTTGGRAERPRGGSPLGSGAGGLLCGRNQASNVVGSVGRYGAVARAILGLKIVKFDVETEEPLRVPVSEAQTDVSKSATAPQPGRVCRPAFCVECDVDEPGELLFPIKSYLPHTTFSGYSDAASTDKKILRDVSRPGDCYFRTGDLLRRDKFGNYYFVDRIGDTFRWKGENVSTLELQQVILSVNDDLPSSAGAGEISGLADTSNRTDVEDVIRIEEANVYGVVVPNQPDGRAPLVALTLQRGCREDFARGGSATGQTDEDSGSLQRFLNDRLLPLCRKKLPSYAVPLFVRVVHTHAAMEHTETWKLKKGGMRQQGIDPQHCSPDRLFSLVTTTAAEDPEDHRAGTVTAFSRRGRTVQGGRARYQPFGQAEYDALCAATSSGSTSKSTTVTSELKANL
ncbi:unnamed protein product [Amoebophrya sp. A120]|nr:unnamed protein product [Amoebophrya sp. A120]|eukprot:GSA120T00006490001.1